MTNHQVETSQKQIHFNANPFSLAFDAMGRVFKINQNPAIFILVGSIVIGIGNQIFSNLPDILNSIGRSSGSEGTELTLALFSIIFGFIFFIVSIVVGTIWSGYTAIVGLKNARFENVGVQSGLKLAFSKFGTVFGINFLIGLFALACFFPAVIMAIIGSILLAADQDGIAAGLFIASVMLAIAGGVFAVRFSLARSLSIYAAFDENLAIFPAMKRSAELTKSRIIEAWGMAFPGIIPIIGPLLTCCGLGMHYLQLKVYRDNSAELPKIHILSWLPVFFIAALLLLLILGFVLIAAIIGFNS